MSDQFTLPGFDDPPPTSRPAKPPRKADFNLFLALMPEDDDALRIHAGAETLCRQHPLSRGPIAADRLHVSLFGLAEYWKPLPQQEMDALCARVDAAMAPLRQQPSLPLVFDRLMSFGRPGGTKPLTLVLRPDEASERALKDLHRAVQLTLTLHGIEADGRFTPHMTLLYDPLHIAEQAIEPLAWTGRKLVLILSHYGKGQYERLRSWELGPSST